MAETVATRAPVPTAVARVVELNEFGELRDVRHGQPVSRTAMQGFGVAGGALVIAIPIDIKLQSTDVFSSAYSLLHPVFMALAITVIGGIALGIRALIAGSQSHYRYTNGLVHLRRSAARTIAWAEVERLEPVYQRRGQADVGRILGYRLHSRDGDSMLIPLSRVAGRDRFMDGVLEAACERGLEVG